MNTEQRNIECRSLAMTGFNMDSLGNRTGSQTLRDGTVSFTVDSSTNRYTGIGGNNIYHDDAGNMILDKDSYVYYYDYENRIVKIKDQFNNDVAEMDYDALGRRIRVIDKSADPDVTTLYYYNPEWQVLAEYNGAGAQQRYFIYGNYIDEPLVMNDGTDDYYYAQDHLYSTVALIDDGGTVVERYEYDAYGKVQILSTNYALRTTSLYGNPYAFTGRRLDILDDGNKKIYYYRERYYGPYMARFFQPDPIGYVDGMNLYEYVRGHCVVATDPWGYEIFDNLVNHAYEKDGLPPEDGDWAHGEWNEETPSMALRMQLGIIKAAGLINAVGGDVFGWHDAARHLKHYLWNTGTHLEMDFRRMLIETPMTRDSDFIHAVNDAMSEAERLNAGVEDGKGYKIVQKGYHLAQAVGNTNWYLAVKTYWPWGSATVRKKDCCYNMNLTLHLRDNYEFKNDNNAGGLVTDGDMWMLNHYGISRHFKLRGEVNFDIRWHKGQRIEKHHTLALVNGGDVWLSWDCLN